MIELIDFSNHKVAEGIFYEGNAGSKEAVLQGNEVWMIKYPKTTRDMINPQISYATSPLSEYIGSKIYESLGLPTHETVLGIRKNKIVVGCKDFLVKRSDNVPSSMPLAFQYTRTKELISFHALKNKFMSTDIEEYSGTGAGTILTEVLETIAKEPMFNNVAGVTQRFWDMFVIDTFIGNNDRNNGNWGLVLDYSNGTINLAPVYDNGNAFFNKRSILQMEKRLNRQADMMQDAYTNVTSIYKYSDTGGRSDHIKPFEFMAQTKMADCKAAIERFLHTVDMGQIANIIHSIPEYVEALGVMPSVQKEFYIKLMEIRLEKFKSM